MARSSNTSDSSSASLGFEATLWLSADKLRNNMDAAEYKRVVLGLIFLKYTFDEHHAKLVEGAGDYEGANPEDKDEYLAANVFLVPKEVRWPQLQAKAKLSSIGKDVDDSMVALERDNPHLKGALNKNYGRADLDKHRLGEPRSRNHWRLGTAQRQRPNTCGSIAGFPDQRSRRRILSHSQADLLDESSKRPRIPHPRHPARHAAAEAAAEAAERGVERDGGGLNRVNDE